MKITFDLISDLHVESWGEFDWEGQPTSMLCVVAGDIAKDRELVIKTLTHLGQHYRAVFYIDGNDEHRDSLHDLGESYKDLIAQIQDIPNVTYLQDNVCVVDGVAFIGTNGWWSYDLDSSIDYDQTRLWFQDRYKIERSSVDAIESMAFNDYAYLAKSIQRLQTYQDVKKIVIVTHTAPWVELVNHDIELSDTYRLNTTGNPNMIKVLNEDSECKIAAWCFGHYHGDVDQEVNGIRFVNNCRGRGNTDWCKPVYYPKRIEIDL